MNEDFDPSEASVQAQLDYILSILKKSSLFDVAYQSVEKSSNPKLYLGAGVVYQTVWNHLSDMPLEYGIDDIDIVYFDGECLSEQQEHEIKSNLQTHVGEGLKIDVKNQARVHVWYKDKFGYDIAPYVSVFDAVKSWPITAGSVITYSNSKTEKPEVYAPYGFSDMLSLTVRANKSQITPGIYEKKCRKWAANWPDLTIIPWGQDQNPDRIVK